MGKPRNSRRKHNRSKASSQAPQDSAIQPAITQVAVELPPEVRELDSTAIQAIAESAKELVETIFAGQIDALRSPHYDEEQQKYYVGDQELSEDDSFTISLTPEPDSDDDGEHLVESANLDILPFEALPLNVDELQGHLEQLYLRVRFDAFGEDTPVISVICHGGHFYVPSKCFINPYTFEAEYLVCVYNATPCLPTHRHYYSYIGAEIGNLSFETCLRYLKGAEIDWRKRFDDEVDLMRRDLPTFDPFVDPYDAKNIIEDDFGFEAGFMNPWQNPPF